MRRQVTKRASWDETWMAVADTIACRSNCQRRQVGAVIVSADNVIISTGYNGPPPKHRTASCSTCPRNLGSEVGPTYENCYSLHAETNALLRSDASRHRGGTIYVSSASCIMCARLIAGSGITRVVQRIEERDEHRQPRVGLDLFHACEIAVTLWT